MKLRHLLAGFFACLAFIACEKDKQEQISINKDEGEHETFLPISDITIHPLGDVLTLSYTSQYAWKVKSDCDWLKITPSSGKAGTTKVIIEAGPNVDLDRNAAINFCSDNGTVLNSFTVTQFKAIIDIKINRASQTSLDIYEFKTDGVSKVIFDWMKSRNGAAFIVESNIEWKIEINDTIHYRIWDGQDEISSKEYGDVSDKSTKRTFSLSARANNLDAEVFPRYITVSPRKLNKDGNAVTLSNQVMDALTRVINISQDNLIFELKGVRKDISQIGTYAFAKPFTELGNDYHSNNTYADTTATGCQNFDLIYEDGKVSFEKGSWGNLQPDESHILDSGDTLKCIAIETEERQSQLQDGEVDETQKMRKCIKKKMQLIVPAPADSYVIDRFIQLPLVVDGDSVSTITLSYSQNPYDFHVQSNLPEKNISRLDTVEYKILFRSKGPWTLKAKSDDGNSWLDIVADSKSGDRQVLNDGSLRVSKAGEWTITVNANQTNESEKDRKMTIEIISDLHENKSHTEYISQDPYCFKVCKAGESIKNDTILMSAYKSPEYEFDIECGGPWRIIEYPRDWVKIDTLSLSGDGRSYARGIKVIADDNTGETWQDPRDGKVTIRSYKSAFDLPPDADYDGVVEDIEFIISQNAFVFDVSADPEYRVGALNAEDNYFEITSTEKAEWEISTDASWVIPNVLSGEGMGRKKTYTFYLENNGSLDKRNAFVTVRSKKVDKSVTFKVTQGAYRFNSDPKEFGTFSELNQSSVNFNVDCLGPWTISDCPDWINLSKVRGEGSGDYVLVSVTPKDNYGKERSGSFTVYSKVGGVEHTKKISVSQKDFVWYLEESPKTISLESLESGTYPMKFRSSGEWKAEVTGDDVKDFPIEWISEKTGDGGREVLETIRFKVPENYRKSSRNVNVVITSVDDTTKTHTTIVSQEAYEFSLGLKSRSDCKVLGDEFEIPIICTGDWKVDLGEAERQYLAVEPMSGTGNDTVKVTVYPNYQPQAREGSVRIVTTDASSLDDEVTISQEEYIFGIVDLPSTDITAASKKINLGVNCSGNWKVELDNAAKEFITVNPSATSGNGSVEITVPLNKSASPRIGKIMISSTDNPELKDVVTVSQAGYVFMANTSQSSFDAQGGSFNISLTSTGGWKISDKSDFLTISEKDMSGNGDRVISVNVGLNTAAESRTGKIVLECTDNPDFSVTVEVSQGGYVFESKNLGQSSFDAQGGTFNISLTSTGGWKVSDKSDFLTISEEDMVGNGDKSILVTVGLNPTTVERPGEVVLESTDNPSFTHRIKITQNAYIWNAGSDESYKFTALGGSLTKGFECTGSWKVTLDKNATKFVNVDELNGCGTSEIKISVALNTSDERVGKVTVASTDNPEFNVIWTIEQEAYTWDVQPNDLSSVPVAGGTYSITVNCTGKWKLDLDNDAKEFVRVDDSTSITGEGTQSVTVTVSSNKKASATAAATGKRSGTITVSTTDGSNKTEIIKINQAGEE